MSEHRRAWLAFSVENHGNVGRFTVRSSPPPMVPVESRSEPPVVDSVGLAFDIPSLEIFDEREAHVALSGCLVGWGDAVVWAAM